MNACRLTRTKIQKQKKTSNFQFPISAQPGQFWFSSAGKDIWRSTGKSLFEESQVNIINNDNDNVNDTYHNNDIDNNTIIL